VIDEARSRKEEDGSERERTTTNDADIDSRKTAWRKELPSSVGESREQQKKGNKTSKGRVVEEA